MSAIETRNPYAPPAREDAPPRVEPYELDAEENRAVSSVAFWARALGVVMLIDGVVSFFRTNPVGGMLNVAMGTLLFTAASSFTRVVHTRGNDIQNLMAAIDGLGTFFKVRVFVTLGILALVCLGTVCALGVLGARSHRG